jgi:formate hydrogenlyase subunit 6/NADH:ubiquinone oxidoreductase subunit I
MDYGLDGLMVPVMDYSKGYCDYECNLCGQVCPTGAIKELPLAQKKLVQIGKVQLLKDKCIVHLKNEDCGACVEACPTHAVYAVVRNNVHYPEINNELCIGCGACENMCPEMPKAIVVDGLAEHGKAKEPFYDAKPAAHAEQKSTNEDFPF